MGLGHDCIEDHGVSDLELKELMLTQRIIDAIHLVTKRKGESHEQYKAKVKSSLDSIVVKIADIEDNINVLRLPRILEKDVQRLKTYHTFYKELEQCIDNGKTRSVGVGLGISRCLMVGGPNHGAVAIIRDSDNLFRININEYDMTKFYDINLYLYREKYHKIATMKPTESQMKEIESLLDKIEAAVLIIESY